MSTDPRDALLTAAKLGIQLKEAKSQKVWQWLVMMAKAEADKAMAELLTVNPTEWQKIAELQGRIHRHREMETWMENAVLLGEHAEMEFNANYSTEHGDYR